MRVAWLIFCNSPNVWAFAVFAIVLSLLGLERIRTPIAGVDATGSGVFVENGAVPSSRRPPSGLRSWSSWSGSDNNRGTLVLGPINHARFSILGMGYPRIGGNRIVLENLKTGATMDLALENLGEEWNPILIKAPSEWGGEPMALRSIDDAAEWGGWIALSEPLVDPVMMRWWTPRLHRLADFLLVGVTLLVWLQVMAFVLRWCGLTWEPALPLLAGALTAIAGYAIFWAYFADPQFGTAVAWMAHGSVLTLGLFIGNRRARGGAGFGREFWLITMVAGAVGVFYFAALHAFDVPRSVSDLAAHRFSDWLPADNVIPQSFAEFLQQGRSLKPFFGDWLSSDRPPLQTGWILLLTGPARLVQPSLDTVAQCAGIWFQLLWVPAVWCWLRSLGAKRWQTTVVLAAIVPGGFLFLNSTFVWPKLGAGAFVIGTFTLWFLADGEADRRRQLIAGAALAALGWLAHGGVAFALIALAPLAVWRLHRDGVVAWSRAALAFAVLVLPWMAYQKFYDPPGDRLLKWHLGGVIPPDDHGTWETLSQAYRAQPAAETWQTRVYNTRVVAMGDWWDLFTLSFPRKQDRRVEEANWTMYSLGWWILGFVAIPVVWFVPAVRRRWNPVAMRAHLISVAWAFATLMVWIALMFQRAGTVNHQGSYTVLLILLPALAYAVARCHWAILGALAVLQTIGFCLLWMDPPAVLGSVSVATDSVCLMIIAGMVVLGAAAVARREEQTPAIASQPES